MSEDAITLSDGETLAPIAMLEIANDAATTMALSPNGRQIAVGTKSGKIYLYDVSLAGLTQLAKARAEIVQPALDVVQWKDLWRYGPR
jgi:hypothetical protein